MGLMNDLYRGATGPDDIVSVRTGWSDEHIHTELMTTEAWTVFGRSSAPSFTAWSPLEGTVKSFRTEPATAVKVASK